MRNERVAQKYFGVLVLLNQEIRLANCVVGWRHFLPVDGQVLVDTVLLGRRLCTVKEMLLCYGQHATRAASRVIDGKMLFWNRYIQQLHHEANHFARGEMFSCLLAALF